MKHLLITLILGTVLAMGSNAQSLRDGNSGSGNYNRNSGGNRIQALKIAYLTKELNLTESEAQRFWPIYNDYSSEMRAARIESRRNDGDLDSEEKVLGIKRKYEAAFTKALSKERAEEFFRAEKNFRKYAAKELDERREQRRSYNDNR